MKLTQSERFNSNYSAKIVKVTKFEPHPNPEVTRMQVAHVLGNKVLVGIDYTPGIYLYFPPGCVITQDFLCANNLFRHSTLNVNKDKTGYFEDSGRVKMLNLKKFYSEGLLLDWASLQIWLHFKGIDADSYTPEECSFDTVNHELLCWKYIVPVKTFGNHLVNKISKKAHESRVINEQFRFHYDTAKLKDTPYVIKPDTLLHISSKWHGTSSISAYVLCKKRLSKIEKLYNWIANKLNINKVPDTEYDYLWSSRKVIKNPFYNEDVDSGFYGIDIWGIAHKIIEPHLTKGMTIYYEIVGYLPNGGPIQALNKIPYDYGCQIPIEGEPYVYDKHYSIRIYRITITNVDGEVYEYTARQVQNWCRTHNLHPVKEFYYGLAKDLFITRVDEMNNFGPIFLDKLSTCSDFYMEQDSPDCQNKVPHEGVVLRLEDSYECYKVKCLTFLAKELKDQDAGNFNIEDSESN